MNSRDSGERNECSMDNFCREGQGSSGLGHAAEGLFKVIFVRDPRLRHGTIKNPLPVGGT